jgi:sugar O-acyltransferase (sialic acid O-acetyltransferase NeuD family)
MTRIAIVGAGVLGQTISHHLGAVSGLEHVGWFDDTQNTGTDILGIEVFGNTDEVEFAFRKGFFDEIIIGIGYKHLDLRQSLFERYLGAGLRYATIIHPASYVDRSAQIGEGSVLFPGCVIDAAVTIGRNSVLNSGCVIAHDSTIGEHSFLGPGVNISGFVVSGPRCFLGIGTIVIDGLTIGAGTKTGGGAVLIENFEQGNAVLAGVPARVIRNADVSSKQPSRPHSGGSG